ncbi:MAG: helix-turn-helix domain-containing protein [Candidatus Lambdaproteobacteria bacterium]|nr:helix-turn-helix domain-containing protein [Candidatus Lambdaproteobacteria bacterium]
MDLTHVERIWRALSDPTRRRLLDLLRGGPRTTGGLCGEFPQSRFAVMKHLAVLEEAQLVLVRRRGRERFNFLNAVPLHEAVERWVGRYAAAWSQGLIGLRQAAETGWAGTAGEHTQEKQMARFNQFQIEQQIRIKAPAAVVFKAITKDIGKWWAFRTLGDDAVIKLEPKAGGRFYEEDGAGKSALWGTVVYLEAPVTIRMQGALGMSGLAISHYSYTLEDKGQETVVKLSHLCMGDATEQARKNYAGGWKTLGEKLKAYVERGKKK